jgi:hypothetical protein
MQIALGSPAIDDVPTQTSLNIVKSPVLIIMSEPSSPAPAWSIRVAQHGILLRVPF